MSCPHSQMKRLLCAARLIRLVFVGAGHGPKSAAYFCIFEAKTSHPLCRAIALAHSRGIPPGRYRTVRGLRQVAYTILAHSPPPRMRGMGAYHPAPEQDGWWAEIGPSRRIQSRGMHARVACISDVGRTMMCHYSQAPRIMRRLVFGRWPRT